MPFITQGKTNWKFLLIVIILAIIVGGRALWYAKRPEQPYQPPEIKIIEENTEEKKTEKCEFPDKISGHMNEGVVKSGSEDFSGPEHIKSETLVTYSDWNTVVISSFETMTDAQNYYSRMTKVNDPNYGLLADCEIVGIKGKCGFKTFPATDVMLETSYASIIWIEGKIVKVVSAIEEKKTQETISDSEGKAREKLEIFISAFMNCEIE